MSKEAFESLGEKRMAKKLIYLSMLIILLAASPLSTLATPLSLAVAESQQASVISAPPPTLTVNTAIDENDGSCADGDCSLRDAIAAANPGDTINFAGDYTINLNSPLGIATNLTITGGEQAVTVSGNDTVRVFIIYEPAMVTIDSLTIAHGKTTTPEIYPHPIGGGVKIETGAVVTLTHSVVLNNTTSSLYNDGFWQMYVGFGGGIYNLGTLTIIETTFSGNAAGNFAEFGDSDGGAIYNYGNLTVHSSTFTGNTASMGGAIFNRSSATLTVQDSLIMNNSAPCGGAGITNSGDATVSDSTISDNAAPGDWCEADAAGIGNRGGTMIVSGSIISGNVSEGYYGGLSNYMGTLTVIDSAIFDNAAGGHGGGIFNWWNAALTVINSKIYNNTADFAGGGIYNGPGAGASTTVVNSALFGNQAENGGGIYNGSPYDSGAVLTVINSTLANNTASLEGGGICNNSATPNLSNSILWGNLAATGPQIFNYPNTHTPTIRYSDIEGSGGSGALWDPNLGLDGGGNLASDPLFVDANGADDLIGTSDDDLRLADGSPAIDAADNTAVPMDTYDLDGDGDTTEALPYDLDGASRLQDSIAPDTGNGAAPLVDMGAYEKPNAVDAGPDQSVVEGQLVAFTGATSITAIDEIAWDFGDGTVVTGVLAPTHSFLDNDVYTVMLIITDTLGGFAQDSLLVTVANADPVLGDFSNQLVLDDTALNISVSYTDPGALDTHTAQIDWGDGNVTDGVVDAINGLVGGSHIYTSPGNYTLILTITDDDGGMDTLTVQVVVSISYKVYLPLAFR
jgi:CSLREA domain-containing protein